MSDASKFFSRKSRTSEMGKRIHKQIKEDILPQVFRAIADKAEARKLFDQIVAKMDEADKIQEAAAYKLMELETEDLIKRLNNDETLAIAIGYDAGAIAAIVETCHIPTFKEQLVKLNNQKRFDDLKLAMEEAEAIRYHKKLKE